MGSTDNILKDSIIHGNSPREPVSTVVRINNTIFTEDSLVLDELVRGAGTKPIVLVECINIIPNKSLVNQYIYVLESLSKGSCVGKFVSDGTIKKDGASILRNNSLISSRRKRPRRNIFVVLSRSLILSPGNDRFVGFDFDGLFEAVVVVVDSCSQVVGLGLEVKEG
ncbi:hypothetical protein BCR41DRAFT_61505 [Lobosporangium transversale]|uniref:Uncharacterized protein n=1 Tax=Lobosporangium transversale TaxID=64571 RepID=A0A1Y2GMY1_9FUNG|nr:hypothetical protein BCR41DRAFT_61505 [Lobosporangium transversale]ORZ16151.1 hypothetical protein BCR41DRAFT_61505 [Lobosporangium transversale]|eukprot:XP_021881498.1 hypothetical protein BCR41DRAFT_61505 [Lobosporangium transversale]